MQMPFCPKLWSSAAPAPVQPGSVVINGTVVVANHFGLSAPGKSTTLRLFSGTEVDHETRKGRLSAEAALRGGKKTRHGKASTTMYQVTFFVDGEFGTPGAVAVKNGNRNDQFFLRHVRLDLAEDRSIHFDCNSWVYPYKKTTSDRVFFINTSYLPDKTPEALRLLREEELRSLRGNGRGERKDWERIYDFDYYNDLGNPDNDDHVRPVLGGTKTHPYPRRCRTGRPLSKTDGVTETRKHKLINLDYYIPPDERFSPGKLAEVLAMGVQAVTHFVIPEARSIFHGDVVNFKSTEQLRADLYGKPPQPAADARVMDELKSSVPSHKTYKQVSRIVKDNPAKFPTPQVIHYDTEAWRSDEEFAREMLAGLNPVVIKRLEVFPPNKSKITTDDIMTQIGGLTIQQVCASTILDEPKIYRSKIIYRPFFVPFLRLHRRHTHTHAMPHSHLRK
jgi:lipoxygenase